MVTPTKFSGVEMACAWLTRTLSVEWKKPMWVVLSVAPRWKEAFPEAAGGSATVGVAARRAP